MPAKKKIAKKGTTKKTAKATVTKTRLYNIEIPLVFVILIETVALLMGYLIIIYNYMA